MAYAGVKAPIQLGDMGLLTDLSPNKIPPNALIRATNVSLVNGTVQKAPGTRKFNSVALPAGLVALFDWRPNPITQRLIAACTNGAVYRDIEGGTFNGNTAIKTGLVGLTPNSMFVEGGNESAGEAKKLFLFSFGANQIQVLTGDAATMTTIAAPATDWTSARYPRVGVVHRNRLWAFSGSIAYASDTGDHEVFTSNNLIQDIFPGEGDAIRGAFVFKGRLFAWKDGGFAYWLDDTNDDSDLWFWRRLSANFGLSAPNGVVEALNDMFTGNTTGTLTSYVATDSLGDVAAADVFQNAGIENFVRANTSKVGVPEQHCLYYPEKKQLYMTYRSAYYTYNDMLIVGDLNRPDAGQRFTFWKKGSPQCLALRKDVNDIQRPIYGDKDGYVHFMDYEDRLEGATSYTGEFQTPHMDFSFMDQGLANVNKSFDHLSVTYVPEGNWNLSCDYFIDGKFVETIQFPMIQYNDPQLDVFLLSTARLGQGNTETITKRLNGMGRTISFRFYNSGSNQSFQIPGIVVSFRPSAEQAQRAT